MKKTIFWAFSLFFLIGGLAFLPSFASILMFVLAVWFVPVNAIQEIFKSLFPKKWIKNLITAVLVIVAIASAPTNKTIEQQSTKNNNNELIQTVQDKQIEIHDTVVLEKNKTIQEPEIVKPAESTEKEEPEFEKPEAENTVEISETEKEAVLDPEITDKLEAETPVISSPVSTEDSTFEVHFIDVGQADAALVLCDGKAMLVDGGNVGDSSKIYSHLKNHEVNHLDFVVGTHAHEDHIGGLAGALNYASVDKVYCPVKTYDSEAFRDFVKYVEKKNAEIEVPEVGASFFLGSAEVKVLACNSCYDANNSSIVLKITYGNTSFLFTADAERDAEQVILNSGYDLNATVLKVGHHGSETSTSYVFLREIMPEYAVISVGEGNSYGHPTEDTLSRLRDADVKVFRTDLQGDVICQSDGENIDFKVEKNPDADTLKAPSAIAIEKEEIITVPTINNTSYILNINTDKFHYPNCRSVKQMSEKNKQSYSGTREELISIGYSPCGNCNP